MSVIETAISSERILEVKQALSRHRLYGLMDSPQALHCFMQHHVFCVWDFMSLVKSLQRNLTGMQLPWTPPANAKLARLINEIVLDEETDCIPDCLNEQPISHFELYRLAMQESGANTRCIDSLLQQVRNGQPLPQAMQLAEVPLPAQAFMSTTFDILETAPLVQATVFFHSREAIIPPMFIEMVRHLQQTGLNCDTLLLYLERHIALDGEVHGPKAQQVLEQMFRETPELLPSAIQAVERALAARLALWDAVAETIIDFC